MKAHGYLCSGCGRAVYEEFDPDRGPVCHRCEALDAEEKLDHMAIAVGLSIATVVIAMAYWLLG